MGKETNKIKSQSKEILTSIFMEYKVFLVLIIIVVALALMTDKFLTQQNITNVLRQVSINAIIALAFTLVLAIAEIELSVGAIVGLSGMVMAALVQQGLPIPIVLIVGIVVCVLLELVNAFLITIFKLPSFIVTLATTNVFRGIIYVSTKMVAIYGLDSKFLFFGQGYVGVIPVPIIIMLVVFLVVLYISKKTTFGRYTIALGGNREAARACGINTSRVRYGVFALMGVCAGIASVIITGRAASAQVDAGSGMEMDAIAAAVIGGTSMNGGNANVIGTLAGCLIVGVVNNGLNLLSVDSNWQVIVKGLLILFAVVLDSVTSMTFKKSQVRRTMHTVNKQE